MRAALFVALALAVVPTAAAQATVTGDTLPRACEGRTAQRGAEVAPALVVTPLGAIAAWQQDPYRAGGGAAALGVARSADGIAWAAAAVSGLAGCRGVRGRMGTAALDAGPDGVTYLAAVPGRLSRSRGLRSAVAVSASRDGGASWEAPVTLDATFGDSVSVAADPLRPGRAYVVWASADRVLVSHTADGGRTWSPPGTVAGGDLLGGAGIAVLPDGRLVAVFTRAEAETESVAATVSDDTGASWSEAVVVGAIEQGPLPVHADPLASPGVVVAPDGAVYTAWATFGGDRLQHVEVARSGDGGLTWGAPSRAVAGTAHAFAPSLAVSPAGVVGVAAYRLRRRSRADLVVARSDDGGAEWSPRRVIRPFPLRRAPRVYSGARRLGSPALAAAPGGFAIVVSRPPDLVFAAVPER